MQLILLVLAMKFVSAAPAIQIQGRTILVDNEPLYLKGTCYNPVLKGNMHPPSATDYMNEGLKDAPMLAHAGINAIRTYDASDDKAIQKETIEYLYTTYGIYTILPVDCQSSQIQVEAYINKYIDTPGLLMWSLGNEWNYNTLYNPGNTLEQARNLVQQTAGWIKALDDTHPIMTIYGELPPLDTINFLTNIDVWGLNVYRFDDFGELFNDWAQRSQKPMFLTEYGADAFDAAQPGVNLYAQAYATAKLVSQIDDNHVSKGGVTSGGLIYSWSDEWWKAPGGLDEHNTGGNAPGGGPFPDQTFNEEWWGLVEIEKNFDSCDWDTYQASNTECSLRPAYYAYKDMQWDTPPITFTTSPTPIPPPGSCLKPAYCLEGVAGSVTWLLENPEADRIINPLPPTDCEAVWAIAIRDNAMDQMHKTCQGSGTDTWYQEQEWEDCYEEVYAALAAGTQCKFWDDAPTSALAPSGSPTPAPLAPTASPTNTATFTEETGPGADDEDDNDDIIDIVNGCFSVNVGPVMFALVASFVL